MTVGSPTVLWAGFRPERVMDLFRLYVTDTWRAGSRLTLNYGLGWSYEPNALTHDLTKPALLTPILGADGLRPPAAQKGNLSPTFGFAWTATSDGRTVVRGGVGRYFDPAVSTNAQNLINERHLLSPVGTGSLTRTGANVLHDGRPLEFLRPTPLTGADVVAILPSIRADLLQTLNPGNRDFTIRNLDSTKEGQNLYDPGYTTPYAVHASLGFQRELAPRLVLGADVVWKDFHDTFINGIDYNRWNGPRGPVATIRGRCVRMGRSTSTPPAAAPATSVCWCAWRSGCRAAPSFSPPTRSVASSAPMGPALARRRPPLAGCLGSTTTTGSRTMGRYRPINATS
jgi:hypothetical protein